ncbi:hypothetical protein A3C34_00860 [Candidatus Amesbacteria bacterium RIFCSPHIGHO2_02_FULL_48_21]|nr:MAG: hypothetical protein A3C34_00860 [Candidatus Amesbacteria bacterium RIFCSPHIGHO2_02_FULL_48_21]
MILKTNRHISKWLLPIAGFISLTLFLTHDYYRFQIPATQIISHILAANPLQYSQVSTSPYGYILTPQYIHRISFHSGGIISQIAFLLAFNPQARAVTYWNHVFLRSPDLISNVPLVAHELVHTVQYQFPHLSYHIARYLWYYFAQGYESVPYEQEAFKFQLLIIQALSD